MKAERRRSFPSGREPSRLRQWRIWIGIAHALLAGSGCSHGAASPVDPVDGGLVPERVAANAFFGHAVAASGDDVIVGAPGEGDPIDESGAAYVFHGAQDGTWDGGFRLPPPSAAEGCSFGWVVAISGDFAAVGAERDDCGSPGSVHVFQRVGPGNRWDVTGAFRLQGTEPAAGDEYGARVALDGDTLAVSALARPDPKGGANLAGGPVRMYRRMADANVWQLESTLMPDGGFRADERFGSAVAVRGDDVVIGADDNGTFAPSTAVYVFHRTGASWQETIRIPDPLASQTGFGEAVAATANAIVVGAAEGMGDGSAWVIERDASSAWGAPMLVSPLQGESIPVGYVGSAVAIDGTTMIIGMPGIGKARVENRTDRGWTDIRWFRAPRERPYSGLGNAVAVAGKHLIAADEYDPLRVLNGGTVYVE